MIADEPHFLMPPPFQEVSHIVGAEVGNSFDRTTNELTGGDFGLAMGALPEGVLEVENAPSESEAPVALFQPPAPSQETVNESQSVINFMRNVNRIRFNSLSGSSGAYTVLRNKINHGAVRLDLRNRVFSGETITTEAREMRLSSLFALFQRRSCVPPSVMLGWYF